MRNALATSLIAAALFCAPAAVAHDADNPAGPPLREPRHLSECVRTGEGPNTYESVPNWCQMPPGRETLGPCHGGIVVDKAGNIYFSLDNTQKGEPPRKWGIVVYSPEGKFLRGFGGKEFAGCHGLCINEEGGEQFIYAAHLAGAQAVKFKLDGTVVWTIPYEAIAKSGKYQQKSQLKPTAIAVGPNGDVYIADGYGQNWIHQFDKDQKYIRSFGGKGKEPGQFMTCHGLALDTRGEKPLLLVCDRENRRLQHFDLDGNFVKVITTDLHRPCSVSFRGDRVAVAELEGRVAIIDGANKVVSTLGEQPDPKKRATNKVPASEFQEGVFTAPHGISYDKDGNLYVMDWNLTGRVSKFDLVK
jgi:sugar lactone lactonase YvrE